MERRRFIHTGSLATLGTSLLPGIAKAAITRQPETNSVEKVYLIFKTHLDIGFTNLAEKVIQTYIHSFIPQAIELARQTREQNPDHRFVWTTGSWLIYRFLEKADRSMQKQMEVAIEKGDIVWHGIPFTMHSELTDPSLFELGLQLSAHLDKRFGKKTIAGKMTDVPGHTRNIVPLLEKNDIEFLHIGVNPASTYPDVPSLFRWRTPDGSEINVMYQKDYGDTMIIPGTTTAMSLSFTGDNHGPQNPAQVTDVYKKLQKQFPRAQIVAATLNDVAREIATVRSDLPLITGELGDTWIHGVGSDPLKIAQFREMSRLRNEMLENKTFQFGDSTDIAFGIPLLMVAEHTWGLDVKTWLNDWNIYKQKDFKVALSKAKYKLMEKSWEEKREYISNAIVQLPKPEVARERLKKISYISTDKSGYSKISKNNLVFDTAYYAFRLDTVNGGIIELKDKTTETEWADSRQPLFQFAYQTFSKQDYDRFFSQYLTQKVNWALCDFGKPGQEIANAESRTWLPSVTDVLKKQDKHGTTIRIEMAVNDEFNRTVGGSPETIINELFFPNNNKEIQSTLKWLGKPAFRLPEASWFSFNPAINNGEWILDKMDQPVHFKDIVSNGNRKLHAILNNVQFQNKVQSCKVESLDATLVATGERNLLNFDNHLPEVKDGIHFCLHNNVWGTNFMMWFSNDMKFRFTFRSSG